MDAMRQRLPVGERRRDSESRYSGCDRASHRYEDNCSGHRNQAGWCLPATFHDQALRADTTPRVRQVDRLIAVLDSGDDLECEALVVIFPREGLPAPCAFQRVIDDERDPVAVEQVAAAERWMFVRMPAALSHRDDPGVREARIHLSAVAREVGCDQWTRVAALRKALLCSGRGYGRRQHPSQSREHHHSRQQTSAHLSSSGFSLVHQPLRQGRLLQDAPSG